MMIFTLYIYLYCIYTYSLYTAYSIHCIDTLYADLVYMKNYVFPTEMSLRGGKREK